MKIWAEKFYKSKAWLSCRRAFLQSKGDLCERCGGSDNPVPAKIAHHKRYLTPENISDPEITFSWDNLEALCQDCHNREHKQHEDISRYVFDSNGNINAK